MQVGDDGAQVRGHRGLEGQETDGLIVEVHPCPEEALSDGDQSLTIDAFAELMRQIRPFAEAAGRTLPEAAPLRAGREVAA